MEERDTTGVRVTPISDQWDDHDHAATDAGYAVSSGTVTVTTNANYVDLSGVIAQIDEDVKKDKPEEEKVKMSPLELQTFKLRKIREQKLQLGLAEQLMIGDLSIGKNDLIVIFNGSDIRFAHHDIDIDKPQHLRLNNEDHRLSRQTKVRQLIINKFHFDKNMNLLSVNKEVMLKGKMYHNRRDNRIRVHHEQCPNIGNNVARTGTYFIVIDKEEFLRSKGEVWKIKYRGRASYRSILEAKRKTVLAFSKMEEILSKMRTVLSRIFSEDEYEIIYGFYSIRDSNHFSIIAKYTNITITNSIEMSHHIGDILVKLDATHNISSSRDFPISISNGLSGTRLSFSPLDASTGYRHSHLTKGTGAFSGFCTGLESYGFLHTDLGINVELELELLMLKIHDFLSWESLEGGPHFKMEDISAYGSALKIHTDAFSVPSTPMDYAKYLLRHIRRTKGGFNAFRDCFTLINDKGELKYVIDENKFFQTFISFFDNKLIRGLSGTYVDYHIVYRPSFNTFHKVTDLNNVDPKSLELNGRISMRKIRPIYMNGKYLRPYMTEVKDVEPIDTLIFAPHPNLMIRVARVIQYQLTNQLEEYDIHDKEGKTGGISDLPNG